MSGTSFVPYQTKKTGLCQPAVDKVNEIIPPLDYSFCNIESITDAEDVEPRPPTFTRKGKQPPPQDKVKKSNTRILKLNNNRLKNIIGLPKFIEEKIDVWWDLAWLDLSQNALDTISPELTELVNLQILYLHGNDISSVEQVEELVPLRQLRKLTLHCNPLEKVQGYRTIVLSMLPNLQNLDFCCVTKADRKTASLWGKVDRAAVKQRKQKNHNED